MLRLGFETTIPLFERAKTAHALDRGATEIGEYMGYFGVFHGEESISLFCIGYKGRVT
jgi:hypothetical protein